LLTTAVTALFERPVCFSIVLIVRFLPSFLVRPPRRKAMPNLSRRPYTVPAPRPTAMASSESAPYLIASSWISPADNRSPGVRPTTEAVNSAGIPAVGAVRVPHQ